MAKVKKHIEIVRSTVSGLSSLSEVSCAGIFRVLSKHYSHVGISVVNDASDLQRLIDAKPDLVFLGMKFLPVNPELGFQDPEKIWLADCLDQNNISYTGSSQLAHELELNKPLAKQRALNAGLKTSAFYVAVQNQLARIDMPLFFPLFIKPTNRGGGLGIDAFSKANNRQELDAKVASIATDLQSDALVEEYLPGREFSVAILKDEDSDNFSVMPIELVAQPDSRGTRMLSKEVKNANSEDALAVTDLALRTTVSALAIDIFHALGARDYGRIDIRLDKTGIPHFLEANLLPCLIAGYGSFPKACLLNLGLDHEAMVLTIVRLALLRSSDTLPELIELEIPTLNSLIPLEAV